MSYAPCDRSVQHEFTPKMTEFVLQHLRPIVSVPPFPSQSIIKGEVRVAEWLNEPNERRDTLQEVSRSGERQHLVS